MSNDNFSYLFKCEAQSEQITIACNFQNDGDGTRRFGTPSDYQLSHYEFANEFLTLCVGETSTQVGLSDAILIKNWLSHLISRFPEADLVPQVKN